MNFTPYSVEDWMVKIKGYLRNIVKPLSDINQSLDDEEKLRWLIDIDRRHMIAIPKKSPRNANEVVLQEFIAILQEYKKLLQIEMPNYPLYKIEDIRDRIANVTEDIADIYNVIYDSDEQAVFYYKQASYYYTQAIQSHVENGNAETAKRCRQNLERLRLKYEVRVQKAIEHIFISLKSLPATSLEYIETIIDLGEIYLANGDNFEAEKCFLLSETKLNELKADNYILLELTDSTTPIFNDEKSADLPEKLNNKAISSQVRELYRRLYFASSQIYREKAVNEAAKYLELVNKIDRFKENKFFSGEMLNCLNSPFNF